MMWSIPIGIVIVFAYLIYTVTMFFYEKNSPSYLSLAVFLIIVIVFMVCDGCVWRSRLFPLCMLLESEICLSLYRIIVRVGDEVEL